MLNKDIDDLVGLKYFDPNLFGEDEEEFYSFFNQEIDHYLLSIYNVIDLVSMKTDYLNQYLKINSEG